MRRFSLCDENGAPFYVVNYRDAASVLTALGMASVTSIRGSTKASVPIPSGVNGGVLYTARYGGAHGNQIQVSHLQGPVGAGNLNRPCAVTRTGRHITVVFGTDGAGRTVVPTAPQVIALVTTTPEVAALVTAVGGVGAVSACVAVSLTGGLDDGDFLKFIGHPPALRRVNDAEVV